MRVYMPDNASIYVFYDAVCPICRNDRARFERWAGKRAGDVQWCDATEHQQVLREKGVALEAALRSLHIEKEDGHIIEGIEAYQLLMMRIPVLRPVAWLIGLPGIKRALRWYYDRWVQRRLKREGRWSD